MNRFTTAIVFGACLTVAVAVATFFSPKIRVPGSPQTGAYMSEQRARGSVQLSERLPVSLQRDTAPSIAELQHDDAVAALLLALTDEDRHVRLSAIGDLAILGGDQAYAAIAPLSVADADPAVRKEALNALEDDGREAAVPWIKQTLLDPDGAVHEGAVEALANVGGESAAAALAVALHDPDPAVRLNVVAALGEIGGRRAALLLRQALIDDNSTVRESAGEWITELAR